MIKINNVTKVYKVKNPHRGPLSMLQDIFTPKYDEVLSLKDVDFSIQEGQCYGVLGTNGSGKSTMIKMLCGLIEPTKGSVEVLGQKPARKNRDFLKNIGVVFGHKSSLWWDLPLKESFLSQKVIYDISDEDYNNRIDEIVSALNLQDVMERPIKFLSLGERVKAEIAANLLHYPKVIFLDEPTVGLDLISKFELRKFLKSWISKNKSIVILTTHDMVDVEECCDHVILLDKGVVTYNGTYEQVENDMFKYKILTVKSLDSLLNKEEIDTLVSKVKSISTDAQLLDQSDSELSLSVSQEFQFSDISNVMDQMDKMDVQLRRPSLEEALRNYYQSGACNA